MRSTSCTTTVVLLTLAVLMGASLAAVASQEAQLSKFMASRAAKKRLTTRLASEGPDDDGADPWADPASSFAQLPERCKKTPPSGSKEADGVATLPGQPPRVSFRQFAGYVTVDEEHGRELFYYLAESSSGDAAAKPLLLWLNGGPGCSSLGFGAMTELGPFRVNADGKTLSKNRHAWNNLANVIFLESPAGVGFSSSRNASDYATVGDRRTAEDAYVFLVKWLERFPEYDGREFYIAGESYSGHYVPELATVITAMNGLGGRQTPMINLRGIFVGNPYLDNEMNRKGGLEFLWSHGVISDEVWATVLANCSFTRSDNSSCSSIPVDGGNIDIYNIYAPVCLESPNGTGHSSSYLPGYDPCIGDYMAPYFNSVKVKKALHARMNTKWSGCRDIGWDDSPDSMVPIIKRLVDHGLRVWIYSGDFDSMCPLTATRYSVKDLNLTITKEWRPWFTPDSEVGGFIQQYQGGFTLASVRGAGHTVPTSQPARSLVLLYSFLKNKLPPAEIPK
ncbi:hypothetical protein ACP4OV_025536 [Aristida adscensionis]